MESVTSIAVRKIGQFVRTDKEGKNPQFTIDMEAINKVAEFWTGRDKTAKGVVRLSRIPTIEDAVKTMRVAEEWDKNGLIFVHLPYETTEGCESLEEITDFIEESYNRAIAAGWEQSQVLSKLETSVRLLDNEVAFDKFRLNLPRAGFAGASAKIARLESLGDAITWAATESPADFAAYNASRTTDKDGAVSVLIAAYEARAK